MISIRRTAMITAVAAMMSVPTATAASPLRAQGPLTDLQLTTVQPTDGADGRAQVTEHAGASTVSLKVKGIAAADGTTFGAHVHVGGCVAGDGAAAGPHFNIGGPASPTTEVWLDFAVRNGAGNTVAHVPFVIPDGAAASIVIHALPTDHTGAAGSRLACIGIAL